MKSFSLFTILCFALTLSLYAVKPPIKFGHVSEEELKMTYYDKDSSAVAVVLCDFGELNPEDLMFTRVIRIKVLKKEGLYLASNIYPGYEKNTIRGKTYNLEGGEIVETKLKNESVFVERIFEDYYRLRIAMPNVKVGSIFEIEIRHFLPPMRWYFQREIPTVRSELALYYSKYITFQRIFTGYEALETMDNNRWIAKDVPSFKEEPYINSSENYITKFDIDIRSISIPGIYCFAYATSWNKVVERLDESDWFGATLGNALYLNNVARHINETNETELLKLEAAFAAIKKVRWNKRERLYTSHKGTLSEAYSEGVGNSADINLMLVNLLKKLGFDAFPIVLSTKSNGMISSNYPSRNRLNYVIAYTRIGEKEYYLDATEKYLPFGMLPRRCFNGLAQMVINDMAKGVTIKPIYKENKTIMLELHLSKSHELNGAFTSSYTEYGAYDIRKALEKHNSLDSYIDEQEDKYPGLKIQNYTIDNIDSLEKAVVEKGDITIKDMVFELDDNIYITPLLYLQQTENPFKLETRKYPIDFAVPKTTLYSINITIPEEYTIEETPQPIRMMLPEKGGVVFYSINVVGNKISILYKLQLNKDVYYVSEYQYVKEFFSQIIEKQSEPIILKKM